MNSIPKDRQPCEQRCSSRLLTVQGRPRNSLVDRGMDRASATRQAKRAVGSLEPARRVPTSGTRQSGANASIITATSRFCQPELPPMPDRLATDLMSAIFSPGTLVAAVRSGCNCRYQSSAFVTRTSSARPSPTCLHDGGRTWGIPVNVRRKVTAD